MAAPRVDNSWRPSPPRKTLPIRNCSATSLGSSNASVQKLEEARLRRRRGTCGHRRHATKRSNSLLYYPEPDLQQHSPYFMSGCFFLKSLFQGKTLHKSGTSCDLSCNHKEHLTTQLTTLRDLRRACLFVPRICFDPCLRPAGSSKREIKMCKSKGSC